MHLGFGTEIDRLQKQVHRRETEDSGGKQGATVTLWFLILSPPPYTVFVATKF